MQLICGLFGHHPAPGITRGSGAQLRSCVLCHQLLVRTIDGSWEPAEEEGAAGKNGPGAPSNG
jgi:hypothetical protein